MCEDFLVAKAMYRPFLGWGGFGRNQVQGDQGTVAMDGFWIITLGTRGFVGLISYYISMVLPGMLFIRRFPTRLLGAPRVAPCSLAATLLGVFLFDCLLNAFPNMIYATLAGGLIGIEGDQVRAIVTERGRKSAGPAGVAKPRSAASARGLAAVASPGKLGLADRTHSLGRTLRS